MGHEYLSILSSHSPRLRWDRDSAEHVAKYSDSKGSHQVCLTHQSWLSVIHGLLIYFAFFTSLIHKVFYPTLYSVHARLQLAHRLGAGISIWEIGQGLDYFYNLL